MDAEELHHAVMGLKPCAAFHGIGSVMVIEIRAAARELDAPCIRYVPEVLAQLAPGEVARLAEASLRRQVLQEYLDEQMAHWVRTRLTQGWPWP